MSFTQDPDVLSSAVLSFLQPLTTLGGGQGLPECMKVMVDEGVDW